MDFDVDWPPGDDEAFMPWGDDTATASPSGVRAIFVRRHRTWVIAACAGVLIGGAAVYVETAGKADPAPGHTIVVVASATTSEQLPADAPEQVLDMALVDARHHTGQIILISGGAEVGTAAEASISLDVQDTNHNDQNDVPTIERTIKNRIADGWNRLKEHQAALPGRTLTGMVMAAARAIPPGSVDADVYLVGIGLPTAAGEDARVLLGADPTPAAEDIDSKLVSSLAGDHVHVLLTQGTGSQDPVAPATASWRATFLTVLLMRSHPASLDIADLNAPTGPWAGAVTAPPVPNLVLDTRTPTPTPQPGGGFDIPLPISSFFVEDSDVLLVTQSQLYAALKPVVDAYQASHGKIKITINGYCARFGPRQGAITTSQDRANRIADALQALHIPINPANVIGHGYDDPLPDPNPKSPNNRVVILTISPT